MKSYQDVSVLNSTQLSLVKLGPGEVCIGVYENSAGDLSDCIFITNKGLHLLANKIEKFISYTDIVDIKSPLNKTNDTNICLTLKDGETSEIEIKNGSGRFKDVFEFLRFLDRVVNQT